MSISSDRAVDIVGWRVTDALGRKFKIYAADGYYWGSKNGPEGLLTFYENITAGGTLIRKRAIRQFLNPVHLEAIFDD